MNPVADDILMHYGVKRRSGRYPWGSGDEPYQHSGDFLSRIQELKDKGLSDTDIAHQIGLTTTEYRVQKRLATHERRQLEVDRAKSLKSDGYNPTEIARIMGYKHESSIRALLNENTEAKKNAAQGTADRLKKELAEKHYLDVGAGVERELGVSDNTLKEALYILKREGYNVYGIGIPQVTNPGKQTNTPILTDKDATYSDVYSKRDTGEIKSVGNYYSEDGGQSWRKREYPQSVDGSRVFINYGDKGGLSKDGTIFIRRGVEDLNLGNSHYAQVRILVNGSHYLKGMALYSDEVPDGYDIMFNTNKLSGTPMEKVLKKIKDDPDNPFGAAIKANGQSKYIGADGKEHLSAINKIKEEGDWDKMDKNLSQQFLSKQPMPLIKKQLKLTYDNNESEFREIMSLTNPTVKKKLLLDFADQCDSKTVDLKAAALPRQSTQVILPIDKLKETEIFAPNYKQGERVVLIRYPHGGTFEIPELTVNNRNQAARKSLGADIRDAVGINSKVAERLSGADFDGDQVVVIPVNDKVKVKTSNPLKDLEGFDPKIQYAEKPGMKYMTKAQTQKEMGIVSNLITDMTLRGADPSELARAVRHSMVVIDAEKHKLDYRQSEKDNNIAQLKNKYQEHYDLEGNLKTSGASTLLSRRKQDIKVDERRGSPQIDPETGKVSYKTSGRTYIDKSGNVVKAQTDTKLMYEIDDARVLSSGTPQENAYADYANKMKALANTARKEYMAAGSIKYDSSAKATYSKEVDSLNDKLAIAELNAPKERLANIIAGSVVKAKIQDNPDMDKKDKKKAAQLAIEDARLTVGARGKESKIQVTPEEWQAIQAGAISPSKLNKILQYSDMDKIREYAMPRTSNTIPATKLNRIKYLKQNGYTNAEIAEAINIPVSTVNEYSSEL